MVSETLALETAALPVAVPVGPRREIWRRFRRNRPAVLGLAFLVALGSVALLAPLLTDLGLLADPLALDYHHPNTARAPGHPLGTDSLGRDLLARTVYGARVSLSLGILLQVVMLAVGGAVGVTAGYVGGRVDNLLMRFTDVMFAFPALLFVLVMASVLGPGYWNIFLAVAVVSWPFLARLVRGEVLSLKPREFVDAARLSGTRPARIVLRHLAPNAAGPVIVAMTFGVPAMIFLEAFLSFVGVGIRPPTSSWGAMINEGYQAIFAYPYQVLVPAAAISLTTLSFNFIGDGLRDALDPRIRR